MAFCDGLEFLIKGIVETWLFDVFLDDFNKETDVGLETKLIHVVNKVKVVYYEKQFRGHICKFAVVLAGSHYLLHLSR